MGPLLELGLHPRDVDRLTVEEFEAITEAIEASRKKAAANEQAGAVATMRSLGGTA